MLCNKKRQQPRNAITAMGIYWVLPRHFFSGFPNKGYFNKKDADNHAECQLSRFALAGPASPFGKAANQKKDEDAYDKQ